MTQDVILKTILYTLGNAVSFNIVLPLLAIAIELLRIFGFEGV